MGTDRLFLIFLIPPALGIIMAVFGLVASAYAPAMIAGLAFCAPIYCVAAWAIASVFAAVGMALVCRHFGCGAVVGVLLRMDHAPLQLPQQEPRCSGSGGRGEGEPVVWGE